MHDTVAAHFSMTGMSLSDSKLFAGRFTQAASVNLEMSGLYQMPTSADQPYKLSPAPGICPINVSGPPVLSSFLKED